MIYTAVQCSVWCMVRGAALVTCLWDVLEASFEGTEIFEAVAFARE